MTAERRLARIPFAVALVMCLVLGSSAAALAYWAVGGIGSASASTLTLDPPTGVAATLPNPAVRTVHLSWSGRPAPNGGNPDGYYVQRLSGTTPSSACGTTPSSLLPGAASTCDDTGVASGTYTYVLTAVFRSWTASAAGAAVTVPVPALASFTVVPSTTTATAGAAITLTVTAIDQYGATMSAYAGTQCVTLAGPHTAPGGTGPSYPATGSCGSGSSVSFVAGVASVAVTLVAVESTTITVTDNPTAKAGTSGAISVNPGAAARLVFTVQPSTPTTAGTAFATQPRVAVQDAYGNTVTSDTSSVTLAVTGGGAAVSGCTANPLTAVAGVATFAGCKVTKAGSWTLAATDGGLTGTTSSSFTITAGAATTIAVSTGSGQSATVNAAFASPLVALVTDGYANPVPGVSVTFTAPLDPPPASIPTATFPGGSATSSATTNASGLATSPTFTADSVAGDFAVDASASGTNTASFSLTNNPGAASKLLFLADPSTSQPGVVFGTQPVVAITDADGNVVITASRTITLAISAGTGTSGAALTCTTNPLATTSGVASFAGCAVNLAGNGYTLTATATSLTAATSAAFTITTALTPSSLSLVNATGGTKNRLEAGDRLVIRYSGTLKASTLCSSWPSDSTAYTASDGTLTLQGRGAPSGSDELLVTTATSCGGAFNMGYVDLGSTKPAGGAGRYTWNATIDWSPTTGTLTVTLGSPTSTQPSNSKGNITATYRPSSTITDPAGNPITGTATYTGRFF